MTMINKRQKCKYPTGQNGDVPWWRLSKGRPGGSQPGITMRNKSEIREN